MIEYNLDKLQVIFIWQIKGSVFPKALLWAVPSTLLAVLLHRFVTVKDFEMGVSLFSSFNFVLGFLLVFRTQQAYNRFWETSTMIHQIRGDWVSAVSACCACCSPTDEMQTKVRVFKHSLVRMTSLLFATTLQQMAVCKDRTFEIIKLEDFDYRSLKYLAESPNKPLVVLQWLQQLIVQNHRSGIIDVAPPILTRVFQDLSHGFMTTGEMQKITEIPFPFPYAQMVSVMLMSNSLLTPFVLATIMVDTSWCAVLNFFSVFCLWCINYIASEIESPCGDDPNDLPLALIQKSMNQNLIALMGMDSVFSTFPAFEFHSGSELLETSPCPFFLITNISGSLYSEDHPKQGKKRDAMNRAMQRARQSLSTGSMELYAQVSKVEQASLWSYAQVEKRMSARLTDLEVPAQPGPQYDVLAGVEQHTAMTLQEGGATEGVQAENQAGLVEASTDKQVNSRDVMLSDITSSQILRDASHQVACQINNLSASLDTIFSALVADLELIKTRHTGGDVAENELLDESSRFSCISEIVDEKLGSLVQQLDQIASEQGLRAANESWEAPLPPQHVVLPPASAWQPQGSSAAPSLDRKSVV